ncbi:MAG: DNRLRE domain-containing protein [Clostridia bacterium]|nr:DNRLRE domain-containing protein [Clostridia bacterium]
MKRIASIVVLLAIAISLLTTGYAAPSKRLAAREHAPPYEVSELREKNSDTYVLPNGTYECVVYAEDKYFEDGSGNLIEINNSIIPSKHISHGISYAYANKANDSHIYFAENKPSVLVSSEKHSLAFEIDSAPAAKSSVGGSKTVNSIGGFLLSGENFIVYQDAFKHTDIVYEVQNDRVKEYLVLNSASAPTEFTFTFYTDEYTAEYTESGTVGFYDAAGEQRFMLGSLFAIDSANSYTEELNYTIGEAFDGKTNITVSLSKDYARDPQRVYPVLIDPSVMITGANKIKDSFVSSKNPTTNYYMNNYLMTGWDSTYNTRRTYIKFDLPAAIPANAITNAYIRIKKYSSGNAPSVKAYRVTGNWTSSTINWNNKPNFTTANASGTAVLTSNNWYKLTVTDIVKQWYAGTYNNYGFMLKNSTESGAANWATFYSSDAPSPNKPELRITYSGNNYYVNMYLGLGFNDPEARVVHEAVRVALVQNGYTGTDYEFMPNPNQNVTKEELMNQLNSKYMFSCLTHGTYNSIELPNGQFLTVDDVSTLTVPNLKFVYFGACSTGAEVPTNIPEESPKINLVDAMYNKGVDVVIGFTVNVLVGQTNYWTKIFMTEIANGKSVQQAKNVADNDTVKHFKLDYSALSISHIRIRGSTNFVPCPHN